MFDVKISGTGGEVVCPARDSLHTAGTRYFASLVTVLLLILCRASLAAEAEEDKTGIGLFDHIEPSFLLFGDFYWIADHHLPDWEGQTGWWTRRIYATLDFRDFGLGEKTQVRLRLELNQNDDFDNTAYDAKLKDAYIRFEAGGQTITVGRSSTVTFDLIESLWGYRWFEKTPLDVQGVPSRQDGISMSGRLTSDGRWRYRAIAGFGSDVGISDDDTGKVQVALTYQPSPQWLFDLYADAIAPEDDRHSAYSGQFFAAWTGEAHRAGLQWFYREGRVSEDPIHLVSAYYVRDYSRWSIVGRVDRLFEPSVKGDDIAYVPFDPTARATYVLAGIDFPVHPNINLMPNLKTILYDHEGDRPGNDLYVALTLNIEI